MTVNIVYMTDSHITVHTEAGIDQIAPEVHGHFSEHLGRCIYDGLWSDDTANTNGFVKTWFHY